MARPRTPPQFAALASITGITIAVAVGVAVVCVATAWFVFGYGNRARDEARLAAEAAEEQAAAQRGAIAKAAPARPQEHAVLEGTVPDASGSVATTTAGRAVSAPGVAWPITQTRPPAQRGGKASADPAVPVQVAFRALWYLGTDPAAEATWVAAINDPRLPDGVRSDLIVDMIDEGYTDNERPGAADLPLVRARLQILERHSPHAMDEVNHRAFEEAYREMLQLYQRLVAQTSAGR